MKAAPLLAFGLAMFTACGETPERRYEKMADGACECMTPLVELNEQAQKLMADTTAAGRFELSNLFREMEAAQSKALDCWKIVHDKYGSLSEDEWKAAEPVFLKKCPKVVANEAELKKVFAE